MPEEGITNEIKGSGKCEVKDISPNTVEVRIERNSSNIIAQIRRAGTFGSTETCQIRAVQELKASGNKPPEFQYFNILMNGQDSVFNKVVLSPEDAAKQGQLVDMERPLPQSVSGEFSEARRMKSPDPRIDNYHYERDQFDYNFLLKGLGENTGQIEEHKRFKGIGGLISNSWATSSHSL